MRGLAAAVRLWLPALVFVVLNLAALAAYQFVYSGRAEARVARFDRLTSARRQLVVERERLEKSHQSLQAAEVAIRRFYEQHLGTQEARFTGVVAEVRQLARTAGLEPAAVQYQTEAFDDHGVVRRSLSFTVAGRYLDLRRLINLLELSSSFITLDSVTLSEGGEGAELRITLLLSALFSTHEGTPLGPVGERGGDA